MRPAQEPHGDCLCVATEQHQLPLTIECGGGIGFGLGIRGEWWLRLRGKVETCVGAARRLLVRGDGATPTTFVTFGYRVWNKGKG